MPQSAGDKALEALALLFGAAPMEDYVYDVREHECLGWDGPRVAQWSAGVVLAKEALATAGIVVDELWRQDAE